MSGRFLGPVAVALSLGVALLSATTPARADYAHVLMQQLESVMHPPADAPYALTGTAFFVSNKGELLTAAHVVQGCAQIDLVSESMPVTSAVLVASDARPDLAVLRAVGPGGGHPSLSLASFEAREGDKFNVLGYAMGSDVRRANATHIRLADATNPKLKSSKYVLVLDGRTELGDSGAPILDSAGNVAGLVRGGYDDPVKAQEQFGVASANFSIGPSANLIEMFYAHAGLGSLTRSNASIAPIPVSTADSHDDNASQRAAVVRVVCWQASPNS